MLEWFKSKTKIKEDYFQQGFQKGKISEQKKWKQRLTLFRSEADKIIREKNIKIYKMNERVRSIETTLEQFTHLFGNARGLALAIEEESETKLQIATSHYSKMQSLAGTMLSLQREYEKKIPKTLKKIDEFKMEGL
jgi:hypothetical protein